MLITHRSTPLGMRRNHLGRTIRVGPVTVKFLTLMLVALAALFYLAQSSESATKRYKVFELQEQYSKDVEQNEWLKSESLRLKSLQQLQSTANSLNLQPNNAPPPQTPTPKE